MAVTQIIKLDLNNHKADDIIIRVGESYTRKIVFIPGTYDGDDFIPTEFYGREEGPRALFRLVKPDRTFVLQNLTVVHEEPDTGIYSFELVPDEYMSQVAGVGYYDLRINDSDTDEEFLYTVQGRVLIDDDMITDSMIESVAASNGMIFPDDFLTKDEFDPDDYATKEYVDDAIADIPDPMDHYSTEEHIVGTWIDGSTVYEKTLTPPSVHTGDNTIAHGITNAGIFIHAEGSAIAGTLGYMNIPTPSSSLAHTMNIYGFDSTNIHFEVGTSYTGSIAISNVQITIRYTKTS